jgi:hypothetical protein
MSPYFVPVSVPAPIAGAELPGFDLREVAFSERASDAHCRIFHFEQVAVRVGALFS